MASPLAELDSLLQSLQSMKPPGVDAITKLGTTAQVERGQIIDVIINAFTRSPATHKLGVLYCADSIVRQFIAQGGQVNSEAISKITSRMPSMLEEITSTIPAEQKPRLSKLIDIWLGSKTFSADMLSAFKARLDAPAQSSATVPPPQAAYPAAATNAPAQLPAASTPANGYAYAQPPVVPPPNVAMSNPVGTPSTVSQAQFPPPVPGTAAAQAMAAFQGIPVNGSAQPQQPPAMPYIQPQAPVAPPPVVAAQNQAAVTQNTQAPALPALNPAQLQAIQSVVQANPSITADQLMAILAAMGVPLPAPAAPTPQVAAAPPVPAPIAPPNHYGPPGQDQQAYQRERSRSPDYKRRRVTPPARRESPTYGVYDPNAAKSDTPRGGNNDFDRRDRGRGKGRDNVRKRSPPRERMASPSIMGRNMQGSSGAAPKPFAHDNTLPNGRIRVLSRTLFVGGVSGSANEDQLMDYIAQYARVQSCIVNHDKRHAFLKLVSHQDAINAKAAIDQRPEAEYRNLFERMNWAVGFGPTQYADYKKGQSVLPIDVLTDADRKWMKTAELGGTGGLEIMTGMVVEEPDIEIGAGPSSKAISRRGGKSGFNNRNHDNNHGGGGGGRRDRNRGHNDDYNRGGGGYRNDRQPPQQHAPVETHMPEPVNIGPPPPVPQFGALPFQFGQFR